MRKKYIYSIFMGVIVIAISYYWGYLCGKQEADFARYEQMLLGLSNNILIYDALQIGQSDEVEPIIISSIESDFANMVGVYEKYQFESAAHMRCAVSRRFRSLKDEKKLFLDEKSLLDYPVDRVSSYLNAECEGEPSHVNWISIKEDEQSGIGESD